MASQSVVLPVSFGSTARRTRPSGQARSRSRSAPNPSMRMRSIFIGPRLPAAGSACPRSASRPSRSARSATRRCASSAAAARSGHEVGREAALRRARPGFGLGRLGLIAHRQVLHSQRERLQDVGRPRAERLRPRQRHAHEVRRLDAGVPEGGLHLLDERARLELAHVHGQVAGRRARRPGSGRQRSAIRRRAASRGGRTAGRPRRGRGPSGTPHRPRAGGPRRRPRRERDGGARAPPTRIPLR